jgi:hypothetical protein
MQDPTEPAGSRAAAAATVTIISPGKMPSPTGSQCENSTIVHQARSPSSVHNSPEFPSVVGPGSGDVRRDSSLSKPGSVVLSRPSSSSIVNVPTGGSVSGESSRIVPMMGMGFTMSGRTGGGGGGSFGQMAWNDGDMKIESDEDPSRTVLEEGNSSERFRGTSYPPKSRSLLGSPTPESLPPPPNPSSHEYQPDDDYIQVNYVNFQSEICYGFGRLYETKDLADVTIACEGTLLKCHKLVLGLSSRYFRRMFEVRSLEMGFQPFFCTCSQLKEEIIALR